VKSQFAEAHDVSSICSSTLCLCNDVCACEASKPRNRHSAVSAKSRFVCVASGGLPNQEVRQSLYRLKSLEPVSPKVPSATAKNQYRENDD
jgi:hypothetical protein